MKKITIITGAANGLGSFLVKNINEDYVIGIDLLNTGMWENPELCNETIIADLSKYKGLQKVLFRLKNINKENKIEEILLINNAGVNELCWIGTEDEQQLINRFDYIFKINVMAYYAMVNIIKKIFPNTKAKVINIGSQTYRVPQRCSSLYCASKAAVSQMTKVMARELAPLYQVVCVAPGSINNTNMTANVNSQVKKMRGWTDDEMNRYAKSNIPEGRNAEKIEIVNLIKYLASNNSSYINGATIDITGGQ